MDRRAYLTALGATAAAVSGCSEGDGTATPTRTSTTTPEPTPRVTDAGLLLDRDEYATLDDDIESVGQGGLLVVGTEYDLPASDGSARGLVEARVFDRDGTRIETNTTEVNVVTDGDRVNRQAWFAFETADWDRGSYTAEVLVNSDDYGTRSSTEVGFDVVEPLGPGEVEMEVVEQPDEIVVRERFDMTIAIRNLSDRDSSLVVDSVVTTREGGSTIELPAETRENVPADGEVLDRREDMYFNKPGEHTHRYEAVDAEFSFTVNERE